MDKRKRSAPPTRRRVRRNNAADAEQLRADLLDAAMQLFAHGGMDAVSMRAVAAKVGVSAMAPYRYFTDKAELLSGLWQFVVRAVHDQMAPAIAAAHGGRAKQRVSIDVFLRYWETHPDHYRLVYMSTAPLKEGDDPAALRQVPAYAEMLQLVQAVTADVAAELGVDMTHARVAGDIRFAMQLGYLQGVLVNQRFPWSARAALREAYIEQIVATVERCLVHGPLAAPAAA